MYVLFLSKNQQLSKRAEGLWMEKINVVGEQESFEFVWKPMFGVFCVQKWKHRTLPTMHILAPYKTTLSLKISILSAFRSFFGRIHDTWIDFRDLVTFNLCVTRKFVFVETYLVEMV